MRRAYIADMTPEQIKEFRTGKQMSQADLAARLGVDQATVSRAESGVPLPKSAALLLDMLAGQEPAPSTPSQEVAA